MFLCPNPISLKDRLDQQLVLGCSCWSDSYLLGSIRAEEVEAVGCGLCFSTTFQSNLSSWSKVAVSVFCAWFRQEKSQQYSNFCKSSQFPYLNAAILVYMPVNWSSVFMSPCSVTKLYKWKRLNTKRHVHNMFLLHWEEKKKKSSCKSCLSYQKKLWGSMIVSKDIWREYVFI